MDEKTAKRLADLADRLAADGQTAELADELREVTAAIREQFAQGRQATKNVTDQIALAGRLIEIGTMAAAIFHEMNQPLLGIKGFAELLGEAIGGDQTEKMVKWANEIRIQVDRVQEMQRHVASFLRPDTRPGTLVKLDSALDEAMGLFRGRLAKKKVQVGTSVPEDLPGLAIRNQHLVQILVNLIGNALDALSSHDRREMKVAAQLQGNAVRILVADSGPGIAEEIKDSLFEPFHTNKGDEGTGLGLYISSTLAEQYGGSLVLVAPDSLGWRETPSTVFELKLPVVTAASANGTSAGQKPDATDAPTPEATRQRLTEMMQEFARTISICQRVLIVDDEQVIQHVLAEFLQGLGLECDVAETAEEAIKALSAAEYAVVISDKNLPGMDGLGLLDQIRTSWPKIETIMITGYASAESALDAIELGAFDYIPKPFHSLALVGEKVRAALMRHEFEERVHAMVGFLSKTTKALHKELTGGSQDQVAMADRLQNMLSAYRQELTGGHVLVLGPPEVAKAAMQFDLRVTPVVDLEMAIQTASKVDVQVLIFSEAPGMPGAAEVIERMQKANPAVAIFVIAQNGSLDKIVEAMGLGVGDYLIDPLEGEELFLARLKRLVRRQHQLQRYRNLIDALKELSVDLLATHKKAV